MKKQRNGISRSLANEQRMKDLDAVFLARSVSSRDEEGDKIGTYECMSFDSSTTELVLDSFDVFKGRGENDLCQVLSLSANATRVSRELEHTA